MRLIHMFFVVCLVTVSAVAMADEPIPISDLHFNDPNGAPLMLDEIVTIQGVITAPTGVFNSGRTEVYLQDDTGGMNLFSFNPVWEDGYELGDEFKVTGTIIAYNGLTELVPITVELIGKDRPQPEPLLVTCGELWASYDYATNSEPTESLLIRLNGVTWDPGNYALMDDTGTAMMYIDPDTGIPWPEGEFNVVGVMKQFDDAGEEGPWYLGYEILPRFVSDITYGSGPQFVDLPIQTGVAIGSATIAWTTDIPSETVLEFGMTPGLEMDPIALGNSTTTHEVVLTGLSSATVYYCSAVAAEGEDSINSPVITVVGPSESSSGQIDVYFSQSVDTTYSTGVDAVQTNIAERMIERINAATTSIDFCFFAFTLDEVADALIEAHNRGVTVQVIYEMFDPVINELIVAGIDVRTNPDEEHDNTHNKFAFFDARDGDETNDVVWTGSWNASYSGTNLNAENVVVVHDAALAAAYRIEFDEMWEGAYSRAKADNTPHLFLIGGRNVEQYMSPTDGLPDKMAALMGTADTDMFFAIFSFTHDEIFNAIVARFDAGVAVRGVCDAEAAEYGRYQDLADLGIDVVLDNVEQGGADQLMHNKYLMADPLPGGSDPTIVTGSYNWSYSAATYKDENILIIHDATITNIFFQEWMARYKEGGGTWDTEAPGCAPIYIAAAAAGAGSGDSMWATDVGINNNSDEVLTYKFFMLPRGADNTNVDFIVEGTLQPNTNGNFPNLWGSWMGDGAGAINVCVSDGDAAGVTSRTYNTSDAGTFGQAIVGKEGMASAKLIGMGEKVRMGFLTENSAFRTNVGFMNAGATTITIDAEFFAADGTSYGTASINILPFSNNQWNKPFTTKVHAGTVDLGYIDVWSDTADAMFLTYASVVDNETDDPTTIWPFDTDQMVGGDSLSCTPYWIAAGASANGAGGTVWATDLGINNLGSDELTYQFQFLPRGADNTGVAMSDPFTLIGNGSIVYRDIWKTLTGNNGAGAINVCVDNGDATGVTSRTFNIGDEGTFGQIIEGMRGSSAAKVATGEKVRLGYLFENDAFRTNIGFMNSGANEITVNVEFFDHAGNSLGIKSVNLDPYSNNQWTKAYTLAPINASGITAGFADVWSDTADANFLTYASIVDNGTGDPTTIWPF